MRWILLEMRNQRGLYDWPKWVQFLICLADGIPLRMIGLFPNQQASADNHWANANPDDLTPVGQQRRNDARQRLGLNQ